MRTLTTQEFINQAVHVHGNKYDYSSVIYKNAKTKVQILCKQHGIFNQTPDHHIQGNGCPICSIENNIKKTTGNNQSFIGKAIRCHNNLYDYSIVKYVKSTIKVSIICKKHGEFFQTPNSHLAGHGCPKCSTSNKSKLYSKPTDKFLEDARLLHDKIYDYSQVVYKNSHVKIKILCQKHGEFFQTPASHLSGNGCPKCSHVISNPEAEFLNKLGITFRNIRLPEWKSKPVDGYDPTTKTVYEFLGDYWHGNPTKYNPSDIHPRRKVSYQTLYDETFSSFQKLKSFGYNVKYIWETNWKQWNGVGNVPLQDFI